MSLFGRRVNCEKKYVGERLSWQLKQVGGKVKITSTFLKFPIRSNEFWHAFCLLKFLNLKYDCKRKKNQ